MFLEEPVHDLLNSLLSSREGRSYIHAREDSILFQDSAIHDDSVNIG